MAIVRMSKSKKQVQFIDDEGNMFVTSKAYLLPILLNQSKLPFVLLNRMPLKVSEDRFKKSPLWDPDGIMQKLDRVDVKEDALSPKSREKIAQKKQFKDKKVW